MRLSVAGWWVPMTRERHALTMRPWGLVRVEADQCDLRALPVVDRGVELQMRELDLAGTRPAPFKCPQMRAATEPRIEVQALVPYPARIGDLRRCAPEEHRGKAGTRVT